MFEALRRVLLGNPPAVGDSEYRVFTRDFDVTIEASDLPSILGRLPDDQLAAHEEAWQAFGGALQGWRTRLEIDALAASERLRSQGKQLDLSDVAAALLVDQSGSMRGQSMLLAAASCDIAQGFLCHLGVAVEVLGFTTVSWKGGRPRKRWLARGRPRGPGRLCELLNIVYRSFEDIRASTGSPGLKPMLRPDLPKENVDGEAIEWALSRLRVRPEAQKILVVISDGAPVDDSTLQANDLGYLDRHLKAVIARVETEGDVSLVAVGIGFDPSRYYKRRTVVAVPEDLGRELIATLEFAISRRDSVTA